MEAKERETALEAILFAAGEPVQTSRMALALGESEELCRESLQALSDRLSFECRGIRILRLDDSWQMCSAVEESEYIRRALERRKPPQLSQPALEALSVIAYYQPATRVDVEQIRGVDSSYTMGLLLERGLIRECGRKDVPGRPILYETTELFLRSFGLSSLEELPPLPEMGGDTAERRDNEPEQDVTTA